jgi:predicted Zn-dependent protease
LWRSIAIALCIVGLIFAAQIARSADADVSIEQFPLQVHPLPNRLAQWEDKQGSGDYFDRVQPKEIGYLVWSEFPVQIYIQPPETPPTSPDHPDRSWETLAEAIIREWGEYLPLTIADDPQLAQITLIRGSPPPERSAAGGFRARSALTRYHLDLQHSATHQSRLAQRFTITISPTQTEKYQQAALRHELGHALGIWGHSTIATDVLYASQVSEPPGISERDINTLKRVYEQPTRLGWWILVDE